MTSQTLLQPIASVSVPKGAAGHRQISPEQHLTPCKRPDYGTLTEVERYYEFILPLNCVKSPPKSVKVA